jgi:hypothetical protein
MLITGAVNGTLAFVRLVAGLGFGDLGARVGLLEVAGTV